MTMSPAAHVPQQATQREAGWTSLRALGVIGGLALLLSSAALVVSAVVLHSVDSSREGGFLTSEEVTLRTDGFALASTSLDLEGLPGSWLLGETRIRVVSKDAGSDVFVGVARSGDVADYLATVAHSTVTDVGDPVTSYEHHDGNRPGAVPASLDIWVAQDSGSGARTVAWPEGGSWTAVVMHSDGTAPVEAVVAVQAEAPHLTQAAAGAAVSGVATLGGAIAVLIAVVLRVRASGTQSTALRGAPR